MTQRGNRRQRVFFGDDDYTAYRSLMAEWLARSGCVAWAYCLMPNHVHLVVVPGSSEGLAVGVGEAHR
ncbi:MAG: transposase, partial [bacterium]|nr:transposase [bacterium]